MLQRLKNIYHASIALLGCVLYRFPSRELKVIGVTGTDGKTTTVSLIYHILKTVGKKVSMISSVNAQIGDKTYDIGFHVTTPDPLMIQKFLRQAVDQNIKFFILETTSHALDQNRVFGVRYEMGVLTNVTHEHLDYHHSYENYVLTKLKLLARAKIVIANTDDDSFVFVNKLIDRKKLITYGIKKPADVNISTFPFKTNLPGEYNQYNCLASIATCKNLGISDNQIRKALLSFKPVVGRMETVYDKSFKVIIDFAHTPNGLSEALKAVRPKVKGRLIHVFGSAGLRDVTKRPIMGKISDELADISILTAEDPRTESLNNIIEQINKGFKKHRPIRIPDRQEAIDYAIKMANVGDIIILTGKAHEKSMCFGKKEYPWSEHNAVILALKRANR